MASPAVIISYFLAGLLSIAGMLSIAEMTTAMPKAGGDCFIIIRSMDPALGTYGRKKYPLEYPLLLSSC